MRRPKNTDQPLRKEVERAARSLGVWTLGAKSDHSGIRMQTLDGRILVTAPDLVTSVDYHTAALMLIGHAKRLRVDLGECPACVARSGKRFGKRVLAMWEWSAFKVKRGRRVRLTKTAGAFAGPASCQPCPSCTVDGQPTGRKTITWAQAILDVMPARVHASASDWGAVGQALARVSDESFAGDQAIREALTVLADKMQTKGNEIGTWLAAWLTGPKTLAEHAAAILAALHRVECPACRARGSKRGLAVWEWAKLGTNQPWINPEALRGWGTNLAVGVMCRPCPSCTRPDMPLPAEGLISRSRS